MKTQKFDLEKALNGAKVVTRNGKEVKQLTHFDASYKYAYHLYGVIGEHIYSWTKTGQYDHFNDHHEHDLFIAVEPNRIWVNVYVTDDSIHTGGNYNSLKAAKKAIQKGFNYIKTIEITDQI